MHKWVKVHDNQLFKKKIPDFSWRFGEKKSSLTFNDHFIYPGLGVCIEDGYPYRVLGNFYDSILEHYRAVPPPLSPSRPVPKFYLRWSLIWYIKTPRLFPNPLLTWTVSLYNTCHNNGMICLLITTKTLFYWANANKNGFLHVFSTGNLLNSHVLWQTRTCTKERKRAVRMSTKVAPQFFFILHS